MVDHDCGSSSRGHLAWPITAAVADHRRRAGRSRRRAGSPRNGILEGSGARTGLRASGHARHPGRSGRHSRPARRADRRTAGLGQRRCDRLAGRPQIRRTPVARHSRCTSGSSGRPSRSLVRRHRWSRRTRVGGREVAGGPRRRPSGAQWPQRSHRRPAQGLGRIGIPRRHRGRPGRRRGAWRGRKPHRGSRTIGSSIARCGARRRGHRRQPGVLHEQGHPRAGMGTQGGRSAAAAPCRRGLSARLVARILLRRFTIGLPRPSSLRLRQCLARRTGHLAPSVRSASGGDQLGAVVGSGRRASPGRQCP
ncbi:hypothetical protein LAUMK40_02115 [Mycobacterium kansasii]|nr:hypothetical protein LAUMK40_02115 [Mycobacterium kansasii]